MSVIAYSLGAAEEVTGSKHVFEVDGKTFLIDCGAFQGKREETDKKNRNFDLASDKLEAVLLTHAHYDHCGLLPILTQKGFRGNIYATPATRDLANLIMMDSANIQARDAEFLRKKAAKKGEKFNWKPLFSEMDVLQAVNQFMTVSYYRPFYISRDVQVEFFDAGHILGSSMAYVSISGQRENDDIRILYTGDLGRKNKAIVRDPDTKNFAPDYIFLESTYGDRLHEDTEIAMDELARIVNNAVAQEGKIIIPSFAIERTQELVYYLHLLVDQKKIPEIPIYVDSPMATNATSIFRVHPECYDKETQDAFTTHHKNPFGFNALSFTTNVEESKALNEKPGPMIIISADGMCEAGRILHHLANNISDPANTILLVGFMAENTLGRRIKNRETEVKIMGDWYKVEAEIEEINAFSAHADYQEILDWLNAIDTSRLKKIFMVHGEKDAQSHLKEYLEKNGFPNVEIVKYGKTYNLD
ncbi:MAG: MBL fold metallo-hydrolase [Spirochaetaceae bacterium]|nr:MBL fold metallo-hydrolase [Spirochaetaceae bacterium]